MIFKLGGVLLLLLVIKLMMIGVGIYSAGHLKGDATAINYAGSERMRSYKIALYLNKWLSSHEKDRLALRETIVSEVALFEQILKYLREGELEEGELKDGGNRYTSSDLLIKIMEFQPSLNRFLSLPGIYEPELKVHMEEVDSIWFEEIKPLIFAIMDANNAPLSVRTFERLEFKLPNFVDNVNHLVTLLEDSSNRKVKLFKRLQYFFLMITLIVMIIALYIILLVTKKSVHGLMEGIRAMTAGDFSKRVVKVSSDEMGELADGFNFMAEKLEELYGKLEGKVKDKTEALEERNRELSILYNMVASLNKSLPMEEILDIFLGKLRDYLGIKSGAVRLLDDDETVRLAASMGLNDIFKANIAFGECLCGTLAGEGTTGPWAVREMKEESKLKDCKDCSFNVVVEIPIRYKEKLLGWVNLFQNEIRDFSEQEKLLVQSLNNHLGAAIEYYNLDIKSRKLAIIEERNMLASELHDSIAQALAYLKIQGSLLEESIRSGNMEQSFEDLTQIRRGIEKSNNDVRELLVHFRTKIDSEGLEPSIRKILGRFSKDTGIRSVFNMGPDIPSLSPGAEVHLFHIVQEALTNARKYSKATEVKVSVKGGGDFEVIVEDNGVGFDVEEVKNKGLSHVGIDIMQERAVRLGADLTIETSPGSGTRVLLQ
ncbi:MAG: histidine kinase, partial [bacterium]|nr:histidine kinase [bacterium]